MIFDADADAYEQFMGRYSVPLAGRFVASMDLRPGATALDVGCGPGELTAVLVDHLGAGAVAAVDPSEPFVAAARTQLPGVDVRVAGAETLPFDDAAFDVTAAQLVVQHMADPVAGLAEMARVTRPGGGVAACVWDLAGDRAPHSLLLGAVRDLDLNAAFPTPPGGREGHLAELFAAAGLERIEASTLTVTVRYPTFEDWWRPFTLGIGGPLGTYLAGLDPDQTEALRRRCEQLLPPAPVEVHASAWSVRARPAEP